MSELTLTQLKILVERAVRPVRASTCIKRKMREELLAHVTAVFEEEVARLADEQAALDRTAQRFGNPAELTGQLQESVPILDSIKRFADWVSFRPCESTLRRAVRCTILVEVIALLLLFAMLLLLRGRVGEWPTDALWHTCPVLLISGYLGFTLFILESSVRRLLCEQKRSSWLQFALVLAGSTIVSLTLGLWAYGVSPTNAFWVLFFTVGSPVALAWVLAHDFTARKRYHEDWASLPIE
jgi:hypothetical protein